MIERFKTENLDTHCTKHYKEALDLAGNLKECTWMIATLRNRKEENPKYKPVIIYWDETNKEWAHAFLMSSGQPEVAAFCARLRAAQNSADDLNAGRIPDESSRYRRNKE